MDPRPQSAEPRQRPSVITDATGLSGAPRDILPFVSEVRWLINGVITRARNPNGSIRVITRQEFADFEQALKRLEARWEERERHVAMRELALEAERSKLNIQKRDQRAVADQLEARERIVAVTRTPFPSSAPLNPEAKAALETLRGRLDAQEKDLRRLRAELDERQRFLDESEAMLARKIETQDAMAALLEQRAEDLEQREQRLAQREQRAVS